MNIRKFKKEDQFAAQNIILNGLKEYWGSIDNTLNPDVYDVEKAFLQERCTFVVAELDGRVIGTGGLKKTDDPTTVELCRVSVDKSQRRQGIAKAIVIKLFEYASEMGYKKVLVETTKTWVAPRTLYKKLGFIEFSEDEKDVYMILNL